MPSAFNPFMKGIDFGQLAGDASNQAMMMMLMKQMMGGQTPQTSLGQTPLPPPQGMMGEAGGQANIDRLMAGASQAAGQMNPGVFGGQPQRPISGGPGMDPATIAKLRQMLQQMGIAL